MKQKIATSINVRINVGNFQHIELTKYAEREIEFESSEGRIKLENELTEILEDDLIRTMRELPDKLGKKTEAVQEAVQEVEESIKKSIPKWLESNPEPNLAKKKNVATTAEQKSKQDAEKPVDSNDPIAENENQECAEVGEVEEIVADEEEDLFSV